MADDFANVQVRLPDGRRYALNVWTFGFMRRARYPWPYEEGGDADQAGALYRVVVGVRPRAGGPDLVTLRRLRLGAAA